MIWDVFFLVRSVGTWRSECVPLLLPLMALLIKRYSVCFFPHLLIFHYLVAPTMILKKMIKTTCLQIMFRQAKCFLISCQVSALCLELSRYSWLRFVLSVLRQAVCYVSVLRHRSEWCSAERQHLVPASNYYVSSCWLSIIQFLCHINKCLPPVNVRIASPSLDHVEFSLNFFSFPDIMLVRFFFYRESFLVSTIG